MNLNLISIKGISFNLSKFITSYQKESHAQRYIYYYSLQVVLGFLLKLVVILSLSTLLGILKEAVLCSLVFISIRRFAGGYHADTYLKCLIYTLIIILGSCYASFLFSNYNNIYWGLFILLIILIVNIKYAPCDTPNKPIISNEHRKNLKTKAISINIAWILIYIFFNFNNNYVAFSPIIILASLCEAITLTPLFNKMAPKIEFFCAKLHIK